MTAFVEKRTPELHGPLTRARARALSHELW